ncbi:restriction endonuclease [Chloroflexota bacterium]
MRILSHPHGSEEDPMVQKVNTGKQLELRVADAYRQMGASKVEHDVPLAGNQLDVYVELATPGRLLHKIAVEVKDWSSPVGIDVVNGFGRIVKLLHSERLVDEGIIVSASGFSRPGRDAAQTYGIRLLVPDDLDAMVSQTKETGPAQPVVPSIPLPPAPYVAHPYPLQENFTGRVRERQMLTEWLSSDERPVFALIAIGGMGKSALTWAWLHQDVLGQPIPGLSSGPVEQVRRCRVRKADRPEGVLWWSFYEAEASFGGFLDRALTYASKGDTDPTIFPSEHDKVRALVNLLEERRLLLVLDGFEREQRAYASLSAAYQGDEVVEDARGNFRGCTDPHAADFLRWAAALPLRSRILITSRLFPRELDDLANCRREDLMGLAPEDAVAFFHAQGVQGTRTEIQAACKPCGYHPLTLRLLAGMIVNDPARPGDVGVAADYSPIDELVPREHHILALAYDSLDQPLRDLLSRLAAFRSPVEYDVAATLNPFEGKRELGLAFQELMNRGLLYFDEEGLRYDLHPIVRRYAYQHLVDKENVHSQLMDYLAAAPAPDAFQVETVDELNPVIELYHHTVRAGRYEDALDLYRERLADPLYYRLGAYQIEIDLLRALFDGDDPSALRWLQETNGLGKIALPRLREKRAQAWTLNALASSYSRSGQPRHAVPLLETHYALRERLRDKTNLTIGLKNLASVQFELGELEQADRNLRRSVAWARDTRDTALKASGRRELGRLLAFEGDFDGAGENLDTAMALHKRTRHIQSQGRTAAYCAQRALLMGEPQDALDAARIALQKAEQAADSPHFVYAVRDFAWAYWLIGAAHLGRGDLPEAETHLSEALTRCRRINLVEVEPDILLDLARWHGKVDEVENARDRAEESLSIADRGEYRLKQADAHNFLSQWELDTGDCSKAYAHAETAKERALCDGPPHCYQPALVEAERLLGLASDGEPPLDAPPSAG